MTKPEKKIRRQCRTGIGRKPGRNWYCIFFVPILLSYKKFSIVFILLGLADNEQETDLPDHFIFSVIWYYDIYDCPSVINMIFVQIWLHQVSLCLLSYLIQMLDLCVHQIYIKTFKDLQCFFSNIIWGLLFAVGPPRAPHLERWRTGDDTCDNNVKAPTKWLCARTWQPQRGWVFKFP